VGPSNKGGTNFEGQRINKAGTHTFEKRAEDQGNMMGGVRTIGADGGGQVQKEWVVAVERGS